MSGSLLQLRNIGTEDQYLYSFDSNSNFMFKAKVTKCVTFASEIIEQTLTTPVDFSEQFSTDITSGPDLLSRIYLEFNLPSVTLNASVNSLNCIGRYVDNLAEFLVDYVQIEINGQSLDRQSGRFMNIYNSVTQDAAKKEIYNKIIGNTETFCKPFGMTVGIINYTIPSLTVRLPLQFWFCKNISNAIPLCCLRNTPVKITGKLRSFDEVFIKYPNVITTVNGKLGMKIFSECIYLGYKEQEFFTRNKVSYLIEQVQYNGDTKLPMNNIVTSVGLNFTKPVKTILVAAQKSLYTMQKTAENTMNNYYNAVNQWNNYSLCAYDNYTNNWGPNSNNSTTYGQIINSMQMKISGTDRTMVLPNDYYSLMVPYYKFKNCANGILVYTFAEDPLNTVSPSGSANFTRMNNVQLQLSLNNSVLDYTVTNGNTILPTSKLCQGYVYNNNNSNSISTQPVSNVIDTINLFVYAISYDWISFENGMCSVGYFNMNTQNAVCYNVNPNINQLNQFATNNYYRSY